MAIVPRLHKETSLFDKSIAHDLGEVSDVANAASPKADAIKRTQRIWYRKNSAGAPSTPGTQSSNWVTKDDDGSNAWTKMHIAITSTDKYIYTCEQYEMANGTVGYTSVLLDNTITVIDGGNIITGTVSANAVNATSGTFDSANIPNLDASKITTGQLSAQRIDTASLSIGYSQINNPPSIPTKTSDLTNDSNFATTNQVQGAAQTATNFLTTVDSTGLFVHKASDASVSSGSGVKIASDVDIIRNGESVANYGAATRIGPESAEHIILNTDGMEFRQSLYSIAKLARITGGAALGLGSMYNPSGDSARVHAYSDSGWVNCGVQCSHAQSGHGTALAAVEARAATDVSQVYMSANELTVHDSYGSDYGVYNVSMGNFGKLARCRIDIAFDSVTVPANGGLDVTLTFVNGGFEDANYICAAMPMSWAAGFNNIVWCVKDRAPSTVTISGWNNISYAVTYNIGVIGADSRYGTRT